MAETRCLAMIEEEEIEIDDEFYENIEAPKFVDLTAPDSRRPDDDRRWFCFRVGCDQKHEQELDSEAVYKHFVLRVMAARSPNVRLRKALNRREASANLKCPLTAPAKSRVSRMGYISSLSHKMTDNKVKIKPLSKVAATPNAKVKQSPSVAKALTTPRNQQKKVSNVEQFRSVQSKKASTIGVPKSRLVAKALVFHSPKKMTKIESSIELKTPMRALCSAMKKLELNGAKKNGEGGNNSLPVAASKKQLRGREVKSRVFDSLYSNNRKKPETNTVTSLKEKKVTKGMQKRQVTVPHENGSSDMEVDEKSRCDTQERCHESGTSGSGGELSLGDEKSQESTRGESSVPVLEEASGGDIASLSSSNNEENKSTERSENEERRNTVSDKGKVSETKKRKAEENSVASDDKENERQLTENDGKENASAPHENIAMSTNNEDPKKAILGSKHHEDSRKTHKKSTSTSTTSQVVKYRKLKPTNPKPFKLRTDERGILKEANLDRKISSPLKETTVKGGGKAMRKHQNVNRVSSVPL
ncbi:isoleucine N-monooxygenase [Spatholobus suberectus]|nr:isoleucine N-monooxygenase [Spatholobus suberectus]